MPITPPQSAHIAMFSIAAHGHVNPNLEVIRELVRRGHRVSYAIPPQLAEVVADTGAEPKVWNSVLPGPEADPAEWGTEVIDNMEPFLTDAIQALPQLTELYDGDVPDLVLADSSSFPSRVLAYRWGVPHIQLTPHMVAWEGFHEEVSGPLSAQITSTERGRAYFRRFREWLDENGVTMNTDDFMGKPDRSLVLIPRVLQPNADRVDTDRYTFVGACQGDRSHQGGWQRPAGAERVLLVSLGSAFTKTPEFYRECVTAFGDLPGWHVVLQIGQHVAASELGPLPDNFEVHHWVPQLAILQQADAFVTHAGAGGSQEGMATATPMIAVPQAADQPGNAALLESLGVARHVPKEEATAKALRDALDDLLADPQLPDRLRSVQQAVTQEGGTRQAADVIESHLAALQQEGSAS